MKATNNTNNTSAKGLTMEALFAQFMEYAQAQGMDLSTSKGNTSKGNTSTSKGNTSKGNTSKGVRIQSMRMSYLPESFVQACKPETFTLSSSRDNHPFAIATAEVATSGNSTIVNALSVALSRGKKAQLSGDYVDAARAAFNARAIAEDAKDLSAFAAAHMLALTYLSIAAELSGLHAVLDVWAQSRANVIKSVRVERSALKAQNMRLVIERKGEGKRPIYLSVNTTASMDMRKVDAAFNRRLANQAAKKAAVK